MSLKFYTDTHVPKQIALQLREHGVDIVRCEDVGLAEADDETHLEYGTQDERILITFDKGFRTRAFEWLANNKHHSGILLCKHYLQGEKGIGILVEHCLFYWEAVEIGAATILDFADRVIDIE